MWSVDRCRVRSVCRRKSSLCRRWKATVGRVLLSIDAVCFSSRIERYKREGSKNSSVCFLLLLVLLGMYLKDKKKIFQFFGSNKKPRLNLTKSDVMAIEAPRQQRQI